MAFAPSSLLLDASLGGARRSRAILLRRHALELSEDHVKALTGAKAAKMPDPLCAERRRGEHALGALHAQALRVLAKRHAFTGGEQLGKVAGGKTSDA